MDARAARAIAGRWVAEQVAHASGEILCVFTHGSINWMADDAAFPPSSDVDLALVVPRVEPDRHRVYKRSYGGIAIEAFYLPRERLLAADALLTDWALAPNLVRATALFDPDRIIAELQRALRPAFPRRRWMRRRCRALRDHALSLIAAFAASDSLFYLNGVAGLAIRAMAQMALLADLRNPTVKKALVKATDVWTAYGLAGERQALLRLSRYADLDDDGILTTAAHCRQALVEACRWLRTPFIGDNCVSKCSLPSLDLDVPAQVAEGAGREIFLWVETLYVHAMIALHNDAPPAVAAAAMEVYRGDVAAIRSATTAEARDRMLACRPALDRMLDVCDDIVGRNAGAVD